MKTSDEEFKINKSHCCFMTVFARARWALNCFTCFFLCIWRDLMTKQQEEFYLKVFAYTISSQRFSVCKVAPLVKIGLTGFEFQIFSIQLEIWLSGLYLLLQLSALHCLLVCHSLSSKRLLAVFWAWWPLLKAVRSSPTVWGLLVYSTVTYLLIYVMWSI